MSSPSSKSAVTETSALIPPSTANSYSSTDDSHKHKHKHIYRNNQFPEDVFEHAVTDAYESAISDTEHDDEDEDTRWLRQERLNHKLIKWYKRPSLLMISMIMFIYAVGLGISQSAKIQLFLDLACKSILKEAGDETVHACPKSQLQVLVSQLQGLVSVTGAVVTTLLAGKIGVCSDIYGRRLLILYVLVTAFFSKVVTLFYVSSLVSSLHIWSLVGSHLIESLGGGMFVFLALCNSYITDVVEDHMRIYSIGIVIANLFLGFSIGPALGSLIVKYTKSNMNAVYLDIIITSGAFFVLIFVLPESRSKNARRKSRRHSITLEEERRLLLLYSKKDYYYKTFLDSINIFKPLKMLWIPSKRPDGSKDYKPRMVVILIILIDICLMTCTSALGQIIVLYGTYIFDWNSIDMGYYLLISSTTKTIVLMGFSPFFLHHLKKRITNIQTKKIDLLDITCIRFAVCFEILSLLTLTFANNSYIYIGHSLFLCFESIATPTLHSTVIKYASVESTGAMFGALATVRNLINLVIPASFLYLYSETVAKEPRVIFYVQLGFVLLLVIFVSILGMDQFIKDELNDISDSEAALNSSLELQKEQRERIHKFMIMRRLSSSSSLQSSVKSQTGSPSKNVRNHSRHSSTSILPKR